MGKGKGERGKGKGERGKGKGERGKEKKRLIKKRGAQKTGKKNLCKNKVPELL
jgi:hypothetical protein